MQDHPSSRKYAADIINDYCLIRKYCQTHVSDINRGRFVRGAAEVHVKLVLVLHHRVISGHSHSARITFFPVCSCVRELDAVSVFCAVRRCLPHDLSQKILTLRHVYKVTQIKRTNTKNKFT